MLDNIHHMFEDMTILNGFEVFGELVRIYSNISSDTDEAKTFVEKWSWLIAKTDCEFSVICAEEDLAVLICDDLSIVLIVMPNLWSKNFVVCYHKTSMNVFPIMLEKKADNES